MNKKNILALSILAIASACLTSCGSNIYIIDNFQYRFVNDKYKLVSYLGSQEEVVIKNNIDGYIVSEVDENAFKDTKVKHVAIESGIDCDAKTFQFAKYLTTLDYSGEQDYIPDSPMFLSGLYNLQTYIHANNDHIDSIDSFSFNNCVNLKNIYLDNTYKSIGDGAFENCISLKYFCIPEDINVISSTAFKGINDLTLYVESNTIPECVKHIINQYHFKYVLGKGIYNGLIYQRINGKNTAIDYIGEPNHLVLPKNGGKYPIDAIDFKNLSNVGMVYYEGTPEDFQKIDIRTPGFKTLFFSKNLPEKNVDNYWHFVKGVPTKWEVK